MKKLLLSLLLVAGTAWAVPQSQTIGPFGGLDTNDTPEVVPGNMAQDLLNVHISPGSKSVLKREGYGIDTSFTTSTSPVHGAYKFFDSNGNEVRLWGQDVYLWASVAGASYVKVATGTLNATWQCADYLGFAYCLNSARDMAVKTNGTSVGTTYQGTIPQGTIVATTADRLIVGNTASFPSRIWYSGSTVFTDFTLGTLNTSSLYEDITAPGSQITHLAYRYGRWLWWKDQSFGYLIGTGQTDLNLVTVSDTIGSLDNTDVYDQGITYFRGNDSEIHAYDGSILRRISVDVSPTLKSANRRKSASWIQTSQTDFSAGASSQVVTLSTAVSPGDVTVASFTATDTAAADFTQGAVTNLNIEANDLVISTNAVDITNNGFETGVGDFTGYTQSGWGGVVASVAGAGGSCSITPQTGSLFTYTSDAGTAVTIEVVDATTSSQLASTTVSWADNSCTWVARSITLGSTFNRRSVKLRFRTTNTSLTSDAFIANGNNISFFSASTCAGAVCVVKATAFDTIGTTPKSNITTGSFASRGFDTGLLYSYVSPSASWTLNTATPTFVLQKGTSTTGGWTDVGTSTGSTYAVNQRYVRYLSTFTISGTLSAVTTLDDVTILARSSGTYYSAVNNAPNLTAWSTLGVTDSKPGNSSITYFTRSSTGIFTVSSATPTWVSQTKNATVATSTAPYFQLRADFLVTAATETPTMSDLTFNWFEGNAADKMYATYYDYALWFSVSLGSTTTVNNRVLRFDLVNQLWTLYDVPSNGFLFYNNALYFGDPSSGKTYRFGGVYADNNVAINSYWRSKPFFGDSPFNEKDLRSSSFYCKASSGTTLSVTYTRDRTSTTSYSINLYDSTASTIRHNRNMLAGQRASVFDLQFGDNSTNPSWECFAAQVTFEPIPWRVYP